MSATSQHDRRTPRSNRKIARVFIPAIEIRAIGIITIPNSEAGL